MPTFNFTLTSVDKTAIQQGLLKIKNQLDLRKEVWNHIPVEKKKAWILSGKDDVMSLAWDIYKYLNNNFFKDQGRIE